MKRILQPFEAHADPIQLEAAVEICGPDLKFTYTLNDPQRLVQDTLQPGDGNPYERADGLWQTTCFEAFWGEKGQRSYWELNLSPARRKWNLYRFEDYRLPQPPAASFDYKLSFVQATAGTLTCVLKGQTKPTALEASLCAVIRTASRTHYYAAHHATAKPDFHHRGSFVL